MVIKFLLVVLAIAVVDVFWSWYIQFSADKNPIKAALSSSMIMLIGAFATTSYVHDNVLIFAAMIGAFIGTYFTVRYTKKSIEPLVNKYPLEDIVTGSIKFDKDKQQYVIFDGLEWKAINVLKE